MDSQNIIPIRTDADILNWLASQEVLDGGFHTTSDPDTDGTTVAYYSMQYGISVEKALREVISKAIYFENTQEELVDSEGNEIKVPTLSDEEIIDWLANSDILNGGSITDEDDEEYEVNIQQYALENNITVKEAFRIIISAAMQYDDDTNDDEENEKFLIGTLDTLNMSLDEIINNSK